MKATHVRQSGQKVSAVNVKFWIGCYELESAAQALIESEEIVTMASIKSKLKTVLMMDGRGFTEIYRPSAAAVNYCKQLFPSFY